MPRKFHSLFLECERSEEPWRPHDGQKQGILLLGECVWAWCGAGEVRRGRCKHLMTATWPSCGSVELSLPAVMISCHSSVKI